MNVTRLLNSSSSSLTSVAQRCLATSASRHADKKVSLYQKTSSNEFLQKKALDRRELLINSQVVVNVPNDVSTVSGVPQDHTAERRVRIFKPTKNAMQSATFDTKNWKIEFETRERWENPLMGWGSTGDPLSNMVLQFTDLEDAIEFCSKNGWTYFVDQPQVAKKPRMKNYAENFSWNKRTRIGSK